MNCPNDSAYLTLKDTDSRQEWFKEYYYCHYCDNDFVRTVTYKTQSMLIVSDVLEEKDEAINSYENFEEVNEDDYYQNMEGMINWIIKEHLKELVIEYTKLTKGDIEKKKLKRAIARLLNKISKPTSEEIIAALKGSDLYGMVIKLPRELEKRLSKAKRLIKAIEFLIERSDIGEIENLLESEGLNDKQIKKIKLLIEKDDMVEVENILLNMKEN